MEVKPHLARAARGRGPSRQSCQAKSPGAVCAYLSLAWQRQDGPLKEHVAW